MKRRRKTSKFKQSRSYSKPLFDPQRLLYFSTYNQRQGKVIRPKSSAVSQISVTQTVDDQDRTLESLNQTLQFRVMNRDGYKQASMVYKFNDANGYNGFTKYRDSQIDNYFDRTCPDYELIKTGDLRLFLHSFAPYTPNLATSVKNENIISITRPADEYTRNADIHFIRGVIDTSEIYPDHILTPDDIEVIDDINLQSFTHWETESQQQFDKIEIDVEFPTIIHIQTNPASAIINWQTVDYTPIEPTDNVLHFTSNEASTMDITGFERLNSFIVEGINNTPLYNDAHDIFTTNINLDLRYHIVEFVLFNIDEPAPVPPATTITYPTTTYKTSIDTDIIMPRLVRS